MCQFSRTAERTRNAEQGEKLIVTESPHSNINWVTEPGCPNVAVCLRTGTILAVEAFQGTVRGALFEQDVARHDHQADSIVYLDGKEEREWLCRLPLGTKVQVLQIPAHQDDDFADAMASDSMEAIEAELAIPADYHH